MLVRSIFPHKWYFIYPCIFGTICYINYYLDYFYATGLFSSPPIREFKFLLSASFPHKLFFI